MDPMELKLTQLQTELKSYFDKAEGEKKTLGTVLQETQVSMAAIQKQVDAIDKSLTEKHTLSELRTLETELKENDNVARVMKDGHGSAKFKVTPEMFQQKTTITSGTGSLGTLETVGVLQSERTPGIVAEARRALRVRSLLSARPTLLQSISFVKVDSPFVKASPQVEGNAKLENAVTFTVGVERVKTIATWVPATRQIMEDYTELAGFIRTALPYYVDMEEENQLLTGDGSGENLHGLCHQATAFNTALLGTGAFSPADVIARVIQQIETANEIEPTFIVLNPANYWTIRLAKSSTGEYIFGSPAMDLGTFPLFGLQAVKTNAMTSGYFLVGSGLPVASEIRDRLAMEVTISTEHADYFTRNMVALRAEKRLALVVYRPGSYVYGAFSQSPA
jgi:HK97 family phage major capsid protein